MWKWKVSQLGEKLANNWERLGLFYPLNSDVLEIKETQTNKKDSDLLNIRLENLPKNTWVFENEFYMLYAHSPSKKDEQNASLSSAGKKVEKTLIWEAENSLNLLFVEMKTDLTFDNVSECVHKINASVNSFCIFLAAHPHFQGIEKSMQVMALICYHFEGCKTEVTRYLGETSSTFKREYLDKQKREFLLKIAPITLEPAAIPFAFRMNPNLKENPSGFSIDFNEVNQAIQKI